MTRLVLGFLALTLCGCGGGDSPAEGAREPAGAGTAALTTPAAASGSLHIVRLVARGGEYAFEPAEFAVRSGDVVRFVQTGRQPEAVAFDPAALPAGGAEFLEQNSLLRGPLLTEPGVFFDVSFRDAPPGDYPFYSVPHRESGMQGRVRVEP